MFGFRVALVTLTTTPGGKDEAGSSGSKGNGYMSVIEKVYVAKMEPFNTQCRINGISVPVQVNCTCLSQSGPDDKDGSDVNTEVF